MSSAVRGFVGGDRVSDVRRHCRSTDIRCEPTGCRPLPRWTVRDWARMSDGIFEELQRSAIDIGNTVGPSDFSEAMSELKELEQEVLSSGFPDGERSWLLFTLSSVMNDLATDAQSIEGLELGVEWARGLINSDKTPETIAAQALYNVGTGLASIYQIRELRDLDDDAEQLNPLYRIENAEDLRAVRRVLRSAGHNEYSPAPQRSRALCNLANTLDDSGRWVEAYTAYTDSLREDSTNGNAAGNVTELLRRRLEHGTDQLGHIAAVYDKYLLLAKSLRERTIEVAGATVADRWDSLETIGGQGHFSHVGDELDPYHRWIVEHRLALAATVEGLGGHDERWDSAGIVGVVPASSDEPVPPIFAAMNVLKAEYLVARRLAYRGQQMVREATDTQHPDDSGLYTDTLDGAFYGEGPALLLLAQRAALDVLDKIAVTANEHFQVGLSPSKVDFAGFWKDKKTNEPCPKLPAEGRGNVHLLALSELAADLTDDGMYPNARLLRNAGTHRIVHGTHGYPTGPTKETFSTVDLDELIEASVESLWVCRAAYLYFVDLVDSQLPGVESMDGIRLLSNQV
ncbi:LA2681 family HEPN domain-containing protein [Rhodococcus sp. NPDC057529]|uniref:LA2681 family HEPN domain-containing protein n=1 Tax=Rhodococcus sp. NPDC057529 TaxID=3346158 RepID=UPI00366BA3C9